MGLTGMQGLVGATGLAGATGLTGAAGSTGLQGPQGLAGSAGPAGTAGPTGTEGPAGPEGPAGTAGPAGPRGPAGANGAQGATGPAGTSGLSEYAYVYNLTPQTVAIGADVTFDSNGIMTPGITHAPGSTGIALTEAGDYKVTFSVSGSEPNQMALVVNGAPVPGTIYASGAGTQQNSGQAIIAIAAGDVITVRNHQSSAAVGLASPIGGTESNVNASVVIEKLG
jgi:hypothetical protein